MFENNSVGRREVTPQLFLVTVFVQLKNKKGA